MERIKTISCFFIVITVYFGSICSLALSLYHCVFMCVRERKREDTLTVSMRVVVGILYVN